MIASLIVLPFLVAAPANAQTLLETTSAHVAEGNPTAAYHSALAAVDADPENVDALWAAAFLAYKLELDTEAATYLNRIIHVDPYDDEARVLLARVDQRRGKLDVAKHTIEAVLDANPAYASALALKAELERPGAVGDKPWKNFVRAGVGVGYDSNVALTAADLPEVSRVSSALGSFELAAGATAPDVAVPLTILASLSGADPLSHHADAKNFVPATAGLAFSGRMAVRGMQTLLDVRYNEIFTDLYQSHYARELSPSLSVAQPSAYGQEVRLLVGGDFTVFDVDNGAPSAVLRVTLRDHFDLGRMSCIVEVGGRRRLSADESGTTPGRFSDAHGLVYGESPLVEHLSVFVLASGEGRTFDQGLKETTYLGQGGLRYTFDPFEIHVEYGYSKNLSGRVRSYDRQQVGLGLRFWYF